MNDTQNPIAIQSKEWLVSSLLQIMKKKPFRKITIQEIAMQAQLDRRTFYRNFSSKEDVLYYYIKKLSDEYVIALLKEQTLTIPITLRVFFEMVEVNKLFFIYLKENDLLIFLLNAFNDILPSIHTLIEPKFSGKFENENIQYIFAFNIGGFWNILINWISGEFRHTPDEMAKILHELMTKTFPVSY